MEWIVSRTLKNSDTGAEVTVALARPQQVSEDEWTCAFHVDGASEGGIEHAHGCDGFQALILAIEGLRVMLSRCKQRLTWISSEPGDTGIPRHVPQFFGLAFQQRVEGLLDDEIARHSEEGQRRYEARRAARKADDVP